MITVDGILENLKKLVGEEMDADEIVCAFEDREEEGETDVLIDDSGCPNQYKYYAFINTEDGTSFAIDTEKRTDEDGCETEVITDVWLLHEYEKGEFELRKRHKEIRYKDRSDIKEGCTAEEESDIVKTFNDEQEALEELEDYKTEIERFKLSDGTRFLVTEYYIAHGDDIVEYSKMEIELIEKPSYETIGVFNNYQDAEKAYNDYEGDNEVYIS